MQKKQRPSNEEIIIGHLQFRGPFHPLFSKLKWALWWTWPLYPIAKFLWLCKPCADLNESCLHCRRNNLHFHQNCLTACVLKLPEWQAPVPSWSKGQKEIIGTTLDFTFPWVLVMSIKLTLSEESSRDWTRVSCLSATNQNIDSFIGWVP